MLKLKTIIIRYIDFKLKYWNRVNRTESIEYSWHTVDVTNTEFEIIAILTITWGERHHEPISNSTIIASILIIANLVISRHPLNCFCLVDFWKWYLVYLKNHSELFPLLGMDYYLLWTLSFLPVSPIQRVNVFCPSSVVKSLYQWLTYQFEA